MKTVASARALRRRVRRRADSRRCKCVDFRRRRRSLTCVTALVLVLVYTSWRQGYSSAVHRPPTALAARDSPETQRLAQRFRDCRLTGAVRASPFGHTVPSAPPTRSHGDVRTHVREFVASLPSRRFAGLTMLHARRHIFYAPHKSQRP